MRVPEGTQVLRTARNGAGNLVEGVRHIDGDRQRYVVGVHGAIGEPRATADPPAVPAVVRHNFL